MNARKIGYYAATALTVAILSFGAANELSRSAVVTQTIAHLGYPSFLPTLLGTWKVLAVLALLSPKLPRLKEWAHAGIVFDVTGAILSHAVAGDGVAKFVPPLLVLGFSVDSWALRPASRMLGNVDFIGQRSEPGVASASASRRALSARVEGYAS